jgi:hypothetical protein
MSDFSDFFPAAAGGGIGKTVTVGDYSYPNAQSLAAFTGNKLTIFGDTSAYGGVSSNLNIQMSSLSQPAGTMYVKRLATADTYVTVADITGATNGGACYAILGYLGDTVSSGVLKNWTARITLDGGTAIEYVFAPTQFTNTRRNFVAMGQAWILSSAYTTNGGRLSSRTGMASDSGAVPLYNYYDATTGGYTNQGGWNSSQQLVNFNMIDAVTASTQGLPYLHFTTSLKVEMKIENAGVVTNGYAGSSILIF